MRYRVRSAETGAEFCTRIPADRSRYRLRRDDRHLDAATRAQQRIDLEDLTQQARPAPFTQKGDGDLGAPHQWSGDHHPLPTDTAGLAD
jgi:hypothetical protein